MLIKVGQALEKAECFSVGAREGCRGVEAAGSAWETAHTPPFNKTVRACWLPWPSSFSSLLLARGRVDM